MSTESLSLHTGSACKNCSAATSGNYCQQCGQATHLHVPSAREFLHEFIAHYVALEGKLWKTLALLLGRPGALTLEYIEGRRVRYLEPLRVYLSFSIIFFALFKLGGLAMPHIELPTAGQGAIQADQRARAALVRASAGAVLEDDEDSRLVAPIETGTGPGNALLRERVERFQALSPEARQAALKQAYFAYTPYAIFAMMPLFAFYLKVLYLGSGRRYGEHFLFALHTNAFAFLVLSLTILVPAGWTWLRVLLLLWLLTYLPMAMRRVYGGGWMATMLRWSMLMFSHVVSLFAAVLTAMGLVLMA